MMIASLLLTHNTDAETPDQTVSIVIGRPLTLPLSVASRDVIIGDPAILDATISNGRNLILSGKQFGTTSVTLNDANGKVLRVIIARVEANLDDLNEIISRDFGLPSVQIRLVRQAIVITGSVNTAADAEKIEEMTRAFFGVGAKADDQTSQFRVINTLKISARDQVMLRVVVSEVQRSLLKQLGVDTQGTWTTGNFSMANNILFPTSRTPTATFAPSLSNGGNTNTLTLKALERAGYLKTLAEPTLTAISGESAKFTAGGEIPVPTSNICAANAVGSPSCQTSYGYKPIGVTLSFTPVVINAGRISLHVITEVTEIDPDNGSRTTGGNIPAFRSRKMETTVELASGATLMSAGLIQNQTSSTFDRVPGIGGIPVLGELFQSNDYQNHQSELLISVVPYIAKPIGALEPNSQEAGFVTAQSTRNGLIQKLNSLYRLKARPDQGLFGFEVR